MDILTPRGQATLTDEQRARELFAQRFPKYQYIETAKDRPADVDAFLVLDGSIRAIVETKCRYDCDLDKFTLNYGSEWLVTFDKLERARSIAKALCVKVVGFLYIKHSDVLLVQELIDDHGEYVPHIRVESTRTQATINGGTAVRMNAYIDMRKAVHVNGKNRQ